MVKMAEPQSDLNDTYTRHNKQNNKENCNEMNPETE